LAVVRGNAPWLVFLVGCSARSAAQPAPGGLPPVDSSAAAAPGTGPAPAWTVADPDAGAGVRPEDRTREPIEVAVRFTLTPLEAGARELRLGVPALDIEQVVARVPPEHRCGLVTTSRAGVVGRVSVGCGGTVRARASFDAGALTIKTVPETADGREIQLPEGASVHFDELLPDPAVAQGCDDRAPPVPVKVRLVDRMESTYGQRARVLYLSVPTMGVDILAAPLSHQYCHGFLDRWANTFVVSCTNGENWSSTRVDRKGDALLFSRASGGYDGSELEAFGGLALPCGADVRFPTYHRVDAAYEPPGGRCRGLCDAAGDICVSGCLARFPTTSEESAPGTACQERCSQSRDHCKVRCPL
jgi:hypothetical protein